MIFKGPCQPKPFYDSMILLFVLYVYTTSTWCTWRKISDLNISIRVFLVCEYCDCFFKNVMGFDLLFAFFFF